MEMISALQMKKSSTESLHELPKDTQLLNSTTMLGLRPSIQSQTENFLSDMKSGRNFIRSYLFSKKKKKGQGFFKKYFSRTEVSPTT